MTYEKIHLNKHMSYTFLCAVSAGLLTWRVSGQESQLTVQAEGDNIAAQLSGSQIMLEFSHRGALSKPEALLWHQRTTNEGVSEQLAKISHVKWDRSIWSHEWSSRVQTRNVSCQWPHEWLPRGLIGLTTCRRIWFWGLFDISWWWRWCAVQATSRGIYQPFKQCQMGNFINQPKKRCMSQYLQYYSHLNCTESNYSPRL